MALQVFLSFFADFSLFVTLRISNLSQPNPANMSILHFKNGEGPITSANSNFLVYHRSQSYFLGSEKKQCGSSTRYKMLLSLQRLIAER